LAAFAALSFRSGWSFFGSTRPTYTDGLYVGVEAIASTAPSTGSSATSAPPSAFHDLLACAVSIPNRSARSAAR
jgi:hypothetical protein